MVDKGHDIDALARTVDGSFFGAFIRAEKPAVAATSSCCGPTCCGN